MLDAVPLDTDTELDLSPAWADKPVVFSAAETFPTVSELVATAYVFDNYGRNTSGKKSDFEKCIRRFCKDAIDYQTAAELKYTMTR